MNGEFTDSVAKANTQAECDKRNKHKGRSLSHVSWIPLWSRERGWHPELKPVKESVQCSSPQPAA